MKRLHKHQPKGLPVQWSKHLKTEGERKNFEEAVRNSTLALSRLYNILRDQLEDIQAQELSPEYYEKVNLEERHIFNNGKKSHIIEMMNLLGNFK